MFCAWVFCVPGVAGVGDYDNRFYVDKQMWATEPYKNFVHLKSILGNIYYSCTAQYVSKNIIISAGHCLKDNAKYEAVNYEGKTIALSLLKTDYSEGQAFHTTGDWAIFLVQDPKYYSDSFFTTTIPSVDAGSIDVLNAGWGYVRVIEDWEVPKIKAVIASIDKKLKPDMFFEILKQKLDDAGIEPLEEKTVTRLKASECKIVFEDCSRLRQDDARVQRICDNRYSLRKSKAFPNVLATTCDTWQGNSGGGIVSKDGKNVYGVCSFGAYGIGEFADDTNFAYFASTEQFANYANKFVDEYSNTEYAACFVAKGTWSNNACKCRGNNTWDATNYKCVKTESAPPQSSNDTPTDTNPADNSADNPANTPNDNTPAGASGGDEGNGDITDKAIDDLTSEIDDLEKILKPKIEKSGDITDKEIFGFIDTLYEHNDKSEKLEQLKKAYEEAKAKEQALGNKLLTAATVAATGLGMMELMMGKAEQKADADAEQDMAAYMATMRCTYADGKSVKGGPDEIELPGGNDGKLMSYRSEYMSLAKSLKERKEAMDMLPGIESEQILDKAEMGLYDDESKGIEGGAYASLYRAKTGSEEDQAKIDADKEKSAKRVKYGAIALGAGAAVGLIGNYLINERKKVKDMSDDEFNNFVSDQEASQKRRSSIRDCLFDKNKNASMESLIQECTK